MPPCCGRWTSAGKKRVLIGRADDCDFKLVSDRVSRHHCEVVYRDGQFEVRGTWGPPTAPMWTACASAGWRLRNGAVINVPTQVFAFTGGLLHYHEHKSGISVQLLNVYKTVQDPQHRQTAEHCGRHQPGDRAQQLCGAGGRGRAPANPACSPASPAQPPCTAGSVRFDGLDTRDQPQRLRRGAGLRAPERYHARQPDGGAEPDLHSQAAHRPRRQPGGDRRGGGPCHRGGGT